MKTAELDGAALDYYVAKADGLPIYAAGTDSWPGNAHVHSESFKRSVIIIPLVGMAQGLFIEHYAKSVRYSPSVNWEYAGPIIERENITIERNVKMRGCTVIGFHDWRASHPKNYGGLIRYTGSGPTPLIAAMRAFVASKFGDEVPDIKETA